MRNLRHNTNSCQLSLREGTLVNIQPEQVRQVCNSIVEGVSRDMGPLAVWDLLLAIDEHQQWYTEIVCSRTEAEKYLLDRHGAFDSDVWPKVKATKAWQMWRDQSNKMRVRYLQMAVDEIVQTDLDR